MLNGIAALTPTAAVAGIKAEGISFDATTNQAEPGSAGTWFRRDRRFAERAEVARRDVSAHRPADADGAAGGAPGQSYARLGS